MPKSKTKKTAITTPKTPKSTISFSLLKIENNKIFNRTSNGEFVFPVNVSSTTKNFYKLTCITSKTTNIFHSQKLERTIYPFEDKKEIRFKIMSSADKRLV